MKDPFKKVEVRLPTSDLLRLDTLTRLQKCSRNDIIRDAVALYLEDRSTPHPEKVDQQYFAESMQRTNSRICALLVKSSMEIHALYEFLRFCIPEEEGKAMLDYFRAKGHAEIERRAADKQRPEPSSPATQPAYHARPASSRKGLTLGPAAA